MKFSRVLHEIEEKIQLQFSVLFVNLGPQAISFTVGFRLSKTALFDWTFFRLNFSGPSYRQSSRFYSFGALPRGGWCEEVLLYSRRNRLAALCFVLFPRATARRTFVAASWWLSGQSYVRGVALSREPPKLQQAQPLLAAWIETARCCRCVIHTAGERS